MKVLAAIDDFGSGYAGLSLLTRFQPDKIKIDREIVTNIHLSGPKQAIVRSIVSCCTDLEITLVAEGIEKLEEWCWLESAGIRRFRGFCLPGRSLTGWAIFTGHTVRLRFFLPDYFPFGQPVFK